MYNEFDPSLLLDNSAHILFVFIMQSNDTLTVLEVDMKNILRLSLLMMLSAVMTACASNSSVQVTTPNSTMQLTAPGPNPMLNQPDGLGRVARAGAGLWHGIIAPITLVFSFFNSDIHMYEVHNAGSEYDLGFLLGVTILVSLLGLFIRLRR